MSISACSAEGSALCTRFNSVICDAIVTNIETRPSHANY